MRLHTQGRAGHFDSIQTGYFTMLLSLLLIGAHSSVFAKTPAFPGAEGFGRYTTGGRGGRIIEVQNTKDSGPGSLRHAVEAEGKRFILFRTSGNIILESPLTLRYGDVTIAGQTAPGDGICICNYPFVIDADNVIIRFIRVRLGDVRAVPEDAISCVNHQDIIIDHCSFSWGIDEVASFWNNERATVQWCLISESLHNSCHPKGAHGYGGIWGGKGATFHHNLLAHHASRNPRFNGSRHRDNPEEEVVDFRNNVIYNWGFNSSYGGEGGNHNMIANYYKPGPASRHRRRIVETWNPPGKWFIQNNVVAGSPAVIADNWRGGVQAKGRKSQRLDIPLLVDPVETQTADLAYASVLISVGAVLPVRDPVDRRIVDEVRNGTATFGGQYGKQRGIIDTQETVGGWPLLASNPPLKDGDGDGIPDDWELAHSLNPSDPGDAAKENTACGYTYLELYLNDLVKVVITDKTT